MFWFVFGSVIFVVLHKVLEGLLLGEQPTPLRRHLWNLGTAAFFLVALVAMWIVAMFVPGFRTAAGTPLLIATPLVAVGAGVFAYLSYIVYTGRDQAEHVN